MSSMTSPPSPRIQTSSPRRSSSSSPTSRSHSPARPSYSRQESTTYQVPMSMSLNGESQRTLQDVDVLSKDDDEVDKNKTTITKKKPGDELLGENKVRKKNWLSNKLSPSRTPPNEELNELPNLVTWAPSSSSTQIKSNGSPTILKRPIQRGTTGTLVELIANHFKCTKLPKENIVTYKFDFEPTIKARKLRWAIKREWESKYCDTLLDGKCITYDGCEVFVYQSLNFTANCFKYEYSVKNQGLKTYNIKMKLRGSQDNEESTNENRTNEKSTNMLSISPSILKDYLNNQSNVYPRHLINILNFSLKQDICVGDIEMNKFLYPSIKSTNDKVLTRELQGYFRSLRLTQQGLALNVDTFNKSFHVKSSVLDYLRNLLDYRGDVQYMRKILDDNKRKVFKSLRGLVVETNHYVQKISRNHKIIGITEESISMLTISTEDGEIIPMTTYFYNNYRTKIKFFDLPCLILLSKTKNYMPIELCFIIENQLVNDPNGQLRKQMPSSTRIQKILYFMETILSERNKHQRSFNLEFDVKPTKTRARILQRPNIGKGYLKEHLKFWGVLNISQEHTNRSILEDYLYALRGKLQSMGMEVTNYVYSSIDPTRPMKIWPLQFMETFYRKVQATMKKKDITNSNMLIMVVVDGKKRNSYYNEIKYWGDCVKGVPTQVIASENIFLQKVHKNWQAYIQKISMKIICRLGGSNHLLVSWNEKPNKHIQKDIFGNFLAFGADVTHPEGGTNNPSLAAVVGSLDFECSFYGAKIIQQAPGQEFMESNLDSTVTKLLQDFKKMNNNKPLPQYILYYRDGVGESSFKKVIEQELPQIQRGASAAQSKYKPFITMIIIQKRHHTRFFLPKALSTNPSSNFNISVGTVVDSDVCDPQRFDFYLCSHRALTGTPRPSHYVVIYDDGNFSADDLQNITHYLCYIYQRSSDPVSMPAPAYYAHLAAYRAKQVYSAAKAVEMRKNPQGSSSKGSSAKYSMTRTSITSPTDDERKPPLNPIMDFPPIHENHRSKMFYI